MKKHHILPFLGIKEQFIYVLDEVMELKNERIS